MMTDTTVTPAPPTLNNNNNTLKSITVISWRQRLQPDEWSLKLYENDSNEINSVKLCEILLDLMNIGQGPSPLLVMYLRYAISVKLIGYNEFFESVYKYSTISRPQHFSVILDILYDVINMINFPLHHSYNLKNGGNSNNNTHKILPIKRNHTKIISKAMSTSLDSQYIQQHPPQQLKVQQHPPQLQLQQSPQDEEDTTINTTINTTNNNIKNKIYTTTTTTTSTSTSTTTTTTSIPSSPLSTTDNNMNGIESDEHTNENGKIQMNGIITHKRKEMDSKSEPESSVTTTNKKIKHNSNSSSSSSSKTKQQEIDQNHIENQQQLNIQSQPTTTTTIQLNKSSSSNQQSQSHQPQQLNNYHKQLTSFTKLATILFKAIEYYFQEDERNNNNNNTSTSSTQSINNINNLLYKNSVKSLEILSIIQNNPKFKSFIYLSKYEFTLTTFKELVQPFLAIQNSIRENIKQQYHPTTQLISSQVKGQEFAHQQSQLLNPLFQLIKQKYQKLFLEFRTILINRNEILPTADISTLRHGSSQTDKQLILSFEIIIDQEISGNHFKSSEIKTISKYGIGSNGCGDSTISTSTSNGNLNDDDIDGGSGTGYGHLNGNGNHPSQSQVDDDNLNDDEDEEPNQTQKQQQLQDSSTQSQLPQIQKQLNAIKQAKNVENVSDCFFKLLTLKTIKGLNDIEFLLEIVKILFQKLVKLDPNSNEFKKTKLFLLFKVPHFYSLMLNNNNRNENGIGNGSGKNNNNLNNINNNNSKKNNNNLQGNVIENVLYQINQFPTLAQVEENIILSLIQILIKKHLVDINLLKSLFPIYHTDIDSIDSEIQSPPSSELSFDNLLDIHSIADIIKIKELIESLLNSSDPNNVSLMKRLFDFIKNHLSNPFDYQDKLLSIIFNILENIDYNSNKLLIMVIMYIFSDPLVIDCLDVHGYTLRLVMILIDICELYGSTTEIGEELNVNPVNNFSEFNDINGMGSEYDHNQKHLYFYFTIPYNLLYTLLIILYDVKNNKYNLDLIKSKIGESLSKKNKSSESTSSSNFIQWIFNMIKDTNFSQLKTPGKQQDQSFEYQFLKNLYDSSFSDESIEKFQNYSQKHYSSWEIVNKLPNVLYNIFDCYNRNIIQDEKLTTTLSLLFQYIPFSPVIIFDFLSKTKSSLLFNIESTTTTTNLVTSIPSTITTTSTALSLSLSSPSPSSSSAAAAATNSNTTSTNTTKKQQNIGKSKIDKSISLVESSFWGLNENRLLFRLSDFYKYALTSSEENSNDLYKLFEPVFETSSLILFPKCLKFSEFRYYSHVSTVYNQIVTRYLSPPDHLRNMSASTAVHQVVDQFLTMNVSPSISNLDRDIKYIQMRLSGDTYQLVNLVSQEILDIILLSCQVESLYSIRAMELGGYILGNLIGVESLPILLNSVIPSWSEHIQTSLQGQLLSYFVVSTIIHSNALYYIQTDKCIEQSIIKFLILLNDTMKRMLSEAPLNGLIAFCLSTITLFIHLNHNSRISINDWKNQLVFQLYEIISKNQLKKKKKLINNNVKNNNGFDEYNSQQVEEIDNQNNNNQNNNNQQQDDEDEQNYEKLEQFIKLQFNNQNNNNQHKQQPIKSIFNILSIQQLEDMAKSILNLSNFNLAISIFDKNDLKNCSKLFSP